MPPDPVPVLVLVLVLVVPVDVDVPVVVDVDVDVDVEVSRTVNSEVFRAGTTAPDVAPTRSTVWVPSSNDASIGTCQVTLPWASAIFAASGIGVEWMVPLTDSPAANSVP